VSTGFHEVCSKKLHSRRTGWIAGEVVLVSGLVVFYLYFAL
jgi:hypothetical protein